MKDMGVISDYQQLKPAEIKEFMPNPGNMASYRELFLRYRKLYDSVAGLMA